MRSAFGLVLLGACGMGAEGGRADANAIDANAIDANAIDANAIDANAIDAEVIAVPDPGDGPMPADWPDTEPNDTPAQAVRMGVAPAFQIGPYVGHGHLGGGDEADYFVFRSGPQATTMIGAATWPANTNLLDLVLYKVDGEALIPVASSKSTRSDGEFPSPPWQIALEPDTKYLFGVIHVEGESDYCS